MRFGWSVAARMALASLLVALSASGVLAQTSLGGVDPITPSQPPPANAPTPAPAPRPSSPRMDYIPTLPDSPNPAPTQPRSSTDAVQWAAIGFTADGSYFSAWRFDSKSEAEARVATNCAAYGRGACEVVTASGRDCIALANYTGRRWNLSFTAGGSTYPEAQAAAMSRCNSDQRTSGRCQLRTAVCADGR